MSEAKRTKVLMYLKTLSVFNSKKKVLANWSCLLKVLKINFPCFYINIIIFIAAIREDLLHHSDGAYQRHTFLQEDFIPFLQDDHSPHTTREELQEDISPPPYPDDLVLSVLKSPLNHSSAYNVVKESECTGCASNEDYCQDNERDDDR